MAAGAGRRRPPARASQGPGGARGQLSPAHLDDLRALLDAGPAASGWEDQCWTLPRIAGVVPERFGVDDPLAGLALLWHRRGGSGQLPARPAADRIQAQRTAGQAETWPESTGQRRTWPAGGASMTPPARACGRPPEAPGAAAVARRWCQ